MGELPPILVCGDLTVDWLLALNTTADARVGAYGDIWGGSDRLAAFPRPGGSAFLAELIRATLQVGRERAVSVARELAPEEVLDPTTRRVTKSYSVWAPFPHTRGERDKIAWRVSEFRGNDEPQDRIAAYPGYGSGTVFVIDDANIGFREHLGDNLEWLEGMRGDARAIIAKRTPPLAVGDHLWDELLVKEDVSAVVIVSVGDLRRDGALIAKGLSWERLAWELYDHLQGHPLRQCGQLVVTIGLAGAFVWGRDVERPILIYDGCSQEDDWQSQYPGMMIGYGTCMTAALALATAEATGNWLQAAIVRGLQAGRGLHRAGYGPNTWSRQIPPLECPWETVSTLITPFHSSGDNHTFHETDAVPPRGHAFANRPGVDIRDLARDIVVGGFDAAIRDGIPVERMGEWASVDRVEIEGVRSARAILARYLAKPKQTAPLSLAVFGPAGAGKSFVITEAINNLTQEGTKERTFNLTQFNKPEELSSAFHRITDVSLQGRTPIVFWDEFDTCLSGQKLGWLRHFLMPMQDGIFYHEQMTYYIGGAVFVFAGGTYTSMAEFSAKAESRQLKPLKVGDFLSRLSAHVDMRGLNRCDRATGGVCPENEDGAYVLRRAVLLRSLIQRHAPQIIGADGQVRIDDGVLRALLETKEYRHGARSMNFVVANSDLSGRSSLQPSALPAPAQLALHIDSSNFLALMRGEKPPNTQ